MLNNTVSLVNARKLALVCCSFLVIVVSLTAPVSANNTVSAQNYLIGPGDSLQVFVWRNPELSVTVPVRPDGRISIPLVEDILASGQKPSTLARNIEKVLSAYIKEPSVTIIVQGFNGDFSQKVRVIGEAANPSAMLYVENMSLLDVMIAVGGLTEYAAGNKAKVVRIVDGIQREIPVELESLVKDGDVSVNMRMAPGDILVIPESWF